MNSLPKHGFFEQAQSQPDMQDFCGYLAQPLVDLHSLHQKINPRHPDHIILDLRIKKILDSYLPEMVNNFCSFSFEYRNTHIVKSENTAKGTMDYTAKDLLLVNLKHLLSQMQQISQEFHEHQTFGLLVQERLLHELNPQPQDTTEKLKNNFDYDFFKQRNSESSSQAVIPFVHVPAVIPVAQPPAAPCATPTKGQSSAHLPIGVIEIMMVATFLAFGGVYMYEKEVQNEQKEQSYRIAYTVDSISYHARVAYEDKSDFSTFNVQDFASKTKPILKFNDKNVIQINDKTIEVSSEDKDLVIKIEGMTFGQCINVSRKVTKKGKKEEKDFLGSCEGKQLKIVYQKSPEDKS